jgi:hypothetical protein
MIISETTIQNAALRYVYVPNVTLEYIVVGAGGSGYTYPTLTLTNLP